MNNIASTWTVLPAAIAAAALAATAGAGGHHDEDQDEVEFDEASIFFELNHTDGDLGIHGLIDGEPWKKLEIEDPRGREMFELRIDGRLRRQGLTELFFESAEPGFDELSPEEFFRRFPEGQYEIEGQTLEGEELESEVEVTHLMPAPAGGIRLNNAPLPDDADCDENPAGATAPLTISWEPVAMSHPEVGRTGEPIEVAKYQLVVEREEPELLIFSIDLPPSVTGSQVPDGFLGLGEEFKFEIIVREASGNQTAVESCFEIE